MLPRCRVHCPTARDTSLDPNRLFQPAVRLDRLSTTDQTAPAPTAMHWSRLVGLLRWRCCLIGQRIVSNAIRPTSGGPLPTLSPADVRQAIVPVSPPLPQPPPA